jgi:hypothetical protein
MPKASQPPDARLHLRTSLHKAWLNCSTSKRIATVIRPLDASANRSLSKMGFQNDDDEMDERQQAEKKQAKAERVQLKKDREEQLIKLRRESALQRKPELGT